MATVLEAFLCTLGLDASKFEKGLDHATEKAKDSSKEMMKGFLEFFGLMATAGAMVEFVKGQLEAEVSAGRLAKTLNMEVEEVEALEGAAKRFGGSAEGMDASLKGLNSRLEMIAIHGPRSKMALQVFAGMGISQVALKGKDASQVLGMLAEKMKGMSGAKAMALGERLGLDEGTIRMLQSGKENVEQLTAAIKKHVASAEQVEAAEKFEQSMLDVKEALAATGREVLTAVMPALLAMSSIFAKVAAFMRDHAFIVKGVLIGVAAAFTVVGVAALVTGAQAAFAWVMALGPVNLIIGAIALVSAGIYLVMNHLKEIGEFFNQVALHIVFGLLKAFFTVEHAGAKMWASLKASAVAPLEWIWNKLQAIGKVMSVIGKIVFAPQILAAKAAVAVGKAVYHAVEGPTPALAGAAGARPSAAMAQHPAISNNRSTTSKRETHVTIGTITTQAKDAQGLASELPGAIKSHSSMVDQADGGIL